MQADTGHSEAKTSAAKKETKNGTATTHDASASKIEPKGATSDPFQIRDTITGVTYDLRSQAFSSGAYVDPASISKSSLARANKLNSLLLRASEAGDVDKVKEALDSLKYGNLIADVNVKELCDFTPLHNAVGEGHLEVVRLLLEKGANVGAVTTEERTPLHMACYNGNKEIIECLVAKGSNINQQEKDGNTPTHILAERGWSEALSFLLEKNPDLSIKNIYGLTAPEVSTSIEIKKMFPSLGTDQGYNRTVVDKIILHNNRADVVKSIMFKKRLLANAPADVKKEEIKAPSKETTEAENRRMRIIEATRRIREVVIAPCEDKKSVGPDDFQPIKPLGKGSFGQVFLVKHKSSGKLYALKMLDKAKFMSRNLFRYAATERDVLSYSDHPFIVGLHYAFQTAKRLCLVLDYCPGYFPPNT